MNPEPAPVSLLRFGAGFILGLVIGVIAQFFGSALAIFICGSILTATGHVTASGAFSETTQNVFFITWGLWEWIYLGPLALWAFKRKRPGIVSGIVAVGLIGGCFSLLLLVMAVISLLPS